MKPDPITYILATAVLFSCIGFISCALLVSRRIRRDRIETWRQARDHYTGTRNLSA